ncbi:MAG: hypothetical protein WCT05_16160 [Lentisphaeria bacterium]
MRGKRGRIGCKNYESDIGLASAESFLQRLFCTSGILGAIFVNELMQYFLAFKSAGLFDEFDTNLIINQKLANNNAAIKNFSSTGTIIIWD